MNIHLWALILALGMFSGSIGGGTASIWATFRTCDLRYMKMTRVFLLVLFAAFIPLGIWFHFNPCIAGCR